MIDKAPLVNVLKQTVTTVKPEQHSSLEPEMPHGLSLKESADNHPQTELGLIFSELFSRRVFWLLTIAEATMTYEQVVFLECGLQKEGLDVGKID